MTALRLEAVAVREGPFDAVHAMDLEVGTGQALALVGPNGCGSWSILRAIMGLAPYHGSVMLDGGSVDALSTRERVRRGVAFCPPELGLFPDMSVRENLLLGAYLRNDRTAVGTDLARVFDALPRLAERSGVLARHLSGGEQRLLAIARTLMARPRVLLLGAPSIGLSPSSIATVVDLVRAGLGGAAPVVVVADESPGFAAKVATDIRVLRAGRVVSSIVASTIPDETERRRQIEMSL